MRNDEDGEWRIAAQAGRFGKRCRLRGWRPIRTTPRSGPVDYAPPPPSCSRLLAAGRASPRPGAGWIRVRAARASCAAAADAAVDVQMVSAIINRSGDEGSQDGRDTPARHGATARTVARDRWRLRAQKRVLKTTEHGRGDNALSHSQKLSLGFVPF